MSLFFFILITCSVSFAEELPPIPIKINRLSCTNRFILNKIRSGEVVDARISDRYFAKAKRNSTKKCFTVTKEQTFNVAHQEHTQDGDHNLELEDPKSGLFLWVKKDSFDLNGDEAKIKDYYFPDYEAQKEMKFCFTLSADREYKIVNVAVSEKRFKAKVQYKDQNSMSQWLSIKFVDVRKANPELETLCPPPAKKEPVPTS